MKQISSIVVKYISQQAKFHLKINSLLEERKTHVFKYSLSQCDEQLKKMHNQYPASAEIADDFLNNKRLTFQDVSKFLKILDHRIGLL